MKRRKYLLGVGSLAAAGAGAMGTGAFLSQSAKRRFVVTTAHDKNAITGLIGGKEYGSKHSKEYTGYNKKGHLYVHIPRLNSGSKTYFDNLFKLKAQLTKDDGKHKYWIKNKYHKKFKGHHTYKPKNGGKRRPRIRWFCQETKSGNGGKLFTIPTPGGEPEQVRGRWISGSKNSYVKLEPGDFCRVGVCVVTRGLPHDVVDDFWQSEKGTKHDKVNRSLLESAYVQAKAVDH